MGSNQSSFRSINSFNINEWDQLFREGEIRVLNHKKNTSNLIEEHPFSINYRRDIDLEQKIINIRRGDPHIVCALNYTFFNEGMMPYQNNLSGLIYIERICTRLSQAGLIGFPGFLHVYIQAFYGFQKLAKEFKYFRVNPNCIGINLNQVVKVWHHPNFAQLYPLEPIYFEQDMVLSILDSIQQHVDFSTTPRQQPSFKQFLFKNRVPLKFQIVKMKLFQYAKNFNQGFIPVSLPVFPLHPPQNIQAPLNHSANYFGQIHSSQPNFLNSSKIGYNTNYSVPDNYLRQSNQQNFIQPSSHMPIRNALPRPHSHFQRMERKPYINRQQFQNPIVYQNFPMNNLRPPQVQNIYFPPHNEQNTVISDPNQFRNPFANNPSISPSIHHQNYQRFQPVPVGVGMRSSNISETNSVRSRSAQSEKVHYKPLSIQIDKQNSILRNDSQNSIDHRRFENSARQRSHSQFHTMKPHSIPVGKNHLEININNFQMARPPSNFQQYGNQVHRELKPIAIRHAIQGAQFRQTRNENFGSNAIRPQYLITERNYNVDSSMNSSMRSLTNSNYLAVNSQVQQSERPSPRFGQQNLSSPSKAKDIAVEVPITKRLSNEADWHKQSQKVPQPQIIYDNTWKQFTHSKKQNADTEVSQNDSKNIIKNEINTVNQEMKPSYDNLKQNVEGRNKEKINFDDVRQSQSLNNSYKNFYNFGESFEVSSPVQYKLSSQRNWKKSDGDQGIIINRINLFEQREQFTPLNFMQQLKITQTIKKDQYDSDKLEVPSAEKDDKTMQSRSRSRQFYKDVTKLGFLMNSQDENSNTPTSKDQKPMISKQLVHQWTPTYKEDPQTQIFTTVRRQDNYKYQFSKNDVEKITSQHHWSVNEPIYKKAENKADTKYPSYQKVSENYTFEWDPQMLADLKQNVHNRQIID